jgi:hypothetical protein
MPDLLHAFECCWHTCHQTFDSPQVYFDHVSDQGLLAFTWKKVEGGVHCQWHGELFHHLEYSDNLYQFNATVTCAKVVVIAIRIAMACI